MTWKIIMFLVIAAAIFAAMGSILGFKFFTTLGTLAICGAAIVLLYWVFEKLFMSK